MEKRIGIWINGKPLYRKMLEIPNIKGGNGRQYASTDTDISNLNINEVVKIKSVLVGSDGYTVDGNSWNTNTALSVGTFIVEKNILRVRTNQEWAEGYTALVTLYYTKTTD